MTFEQVLIFSLLLVLLGLFAWGRWRHDIVAFLALITATVLGLIPATESFSGFGHPAIVTVTAVLILSRGLYNSGIVDYFVRHLSKVKSSSIQLIALVLGVTICSAFMNNIGALALFMPVAIRMARKGKLSPSVFLMPLAFGSLLGGLVTQIGTPPNIIISTFRAQALGGVPFRMFDFAPVGGAVALAGAAFIVLGGWRLIPRRKGRLSRADLFDIDNYITDVTVPPGSPLAGKSLRTIEDATPGDLLIVGHVRGGQRFAAPSPERILEECDTLIVKASAEELQDMIAATGIELSASHVITEEELGSGEVGIMEAIITRNSSLEGRTARSLSLRTRYSINLLGVSREGDRLRAQPGKIRLRVGDVLLLQGEMDTLQEVVPSLGCLPLAERGLRLGSGRRAAAAVTLFGLSVALAALGFLPVQVSFAAAAVIMIITGLITVKEAYESVEGSVIVLLASMIPLSTALQTTGGAQLIASAILGLAGSMPPWLTLALILVSSMLLANLITGSPAVLIIAPIAMSLSVALGSSPEPFLMATVVGAASAFLTPVGHQSNTLVMGPGGYHFGDYWRLGLPLSVVVTAVAIPMIMLVWPL